MNTLMKAMTADGKGIKQERAERINRQVVRSHTDLINNLQKRKDAINDTIDELSDLSPNSTTSLKVGGKNFNADEWVKQMHEAEIQLEEVEVELSIASKFAAKWLKDK